MEKSDYLEILPCSESDKLLAEKYWEKDENGSYVYHVRDLVTSHGFKNHYDLNDYLSYYAWIEHLDVPCQGCGIHLKSHTRSSFTQRKPKDWKCGFCRDEERESEYNERRELLNNHVSASVSSGIDVIDLTLLDMLELRALISFGSRGNHQDHLIYPPYQISSDAFPSRRALSNAARSLFNVGAICFHPLSPLEKMIRDGNTWGFRTEESPYKLTVKLNEDASSSENLDVAKILHNLDSAINSKIIFLNQHKDDNEIANAVFHIATHEAIGYMEFLLDERNFNLPDDARLYDLIYESLSFLTLGQVFSLLHTTARSASDIHKAKRAPKKSISNGIPTNFGKYLGFVRSGSWTKRSYVRPKNCPESKLSKFFFNHILGLKGSIDNVMLDRLLTE